MLMATDMPLFTPMDKSRKNLTAREVVLFGLLACLTFAAKMVMAAFPNIEPVSLFVMLFAVVFGKKAFFPIYIYVALEFVLWPVGLWNLNYLYIWLIPTSAAFCLRKMTHPLGWAILSGAFGLLFGLFSAPIYWITGGSRFAVAWWLSGIPYDLIHCAANFFISLFLFCPLRSLLERLYCNFI